MKSQINALIESLEESFEGTPWYGVSLLEKLNSINPDLANTIPIKSTNSIARLLAHIIRWRVFALEKLKGNDKFDIEINSPEDWPDVSINSKEDWEKLISNLKASQTEIINILKLKDDSFLKKMTPGMSYPFQVLIEGVTQHDIYHLGQISLIEKQIRP